MLTSPQQAAPIFPRRESDNFMKASVEVALVAKTCGIGRFDYAFSLFQQFLCFSHPTLNLKLMRHQTAGRLKLANHMIRADPDMMRHVFD